MTRAPDAFDMHGANEYPEEQDVTCLHCGVDGLYWQETWDTGGKARPRLYEDGKPHICRPSPDDFDIT